MNFAQQITQSALLHLDKLSAGYDGTTIVHSASIELAPGEIGCLLGPSGCGKSTLLRTIAGFENALDGLITLNGSSISNKDYTLPPEQRSIGMVFQDVALFPHLSVQQNICFGIQHLSKQAQTERVTQLLELIELQEVAHYFPHQLSGGQQQRIALARALAPKPKLILLDEPFSGLDAKLRETLVPHVRQVLKQEGVGALMVSHDQHEAFAIADKVAVMNKGVIQQWDTAYNIYHNPKTRFVATFIGRSKFLKARTLCHECIDTALGKLASHKAHGFEAGESVDVLVRLDDVKHD
ncbi:MAG: ABC transporter ATP-binding protein, partial [Pseudomonadales bacterium]